MEGRMEGRGIIRQKLIDWMMKDRYGKLKEKLLTLPLPFFGNA